MNGSTLDQGCGRRRFRDEIAAAKAVERGAAGRPEECTRGDHWHLAGSVLQLRRTARDTGPDKLTRDLVLARDDYACVCCGRPIFGQEYSLQHRKRRSQGGTNKPSNLITVLGSATTGCHARIDSRVNAQDEPKGYTVRSQRDPARVPVLLFKAGPRFAVWAWATDDGQWVFEDPFGNEAA